MFQRQIIQAYTPILTLSPFPPSLSDILAAPEMTSTRRTPSASEAGESGEKSVKEEEAGASEKEQGRTHAENLNFGRS